MPRTKNPHLQNKSNKTLTTETTPKSTSSKPSKRPSKKSQSPPSSNSTPPNLVFNPLIPPLPSPILEQPSLSSNSTSSSLTRYLSAPLDSSLKDPYQSPQPTLPSLSKIKDQPPYGRSKSSNNFTNLLETSNLPLHHSNLLKDSVVIPLPYHSSFLPFSNPPSLESSSFFNPSGPFPKHISFSTVSSQSDFGSNINTTVIHFIDNLYNTYISTPIVFHVLYNSNLLHTLGHLQERGAEAGTWTSSLPGQQRPGFLSSIQSFDSDIKLQIIQQQLDVFQSFGFPHLASVLSSKQNLYSDVTLFSIRLQNIYFNLCSLLQCIQNPGIQQRSQSWYNIRKSMITASEFGTALGCGSYTTQEQFIQKKIHPDTPFQAFQIALDWGIMFEPIVNLIYQIKNNTIVFDFGFLVHKNFSFFGASPDGITSEGIMVEFKAPFRRKLSDSFPMQYYYQIQGQLDVCNLLECDYVEARFDPIIYDYQDFLFTVFGLNQNCALTDDDDDDPNNQSPQNPLSDSPTNPDIFFGAIVQFSTNNSKKSYKYSSINPTIQQLNDFIELNDIDFQNLGFHLYDKDATYDPNNPTSTYFYKFWILHQSNYQSFRIFKNSPFFHSEINKAYSVHTHILQQKLNNQIPTS